MRVDYLNEPSASTDFWPDSKLTAMGDKLVSWFDEISFGAVSLTYDIWPGVLHLVDNAPPTCCSVYVMKQNVSGTAGTEQICRDFDPEEGLCDSDWDLVIVGPF